MAALCKNYAAQIEAGDDFLPLRERSGVSPTEVMITASGLLQGRQSGGIRAWHVAELDRPLNAACPTQNSYHQERTPWNLLLIGAGAFRSRS